MIPDRGRHRKQHRRIFWILVYSIKGVWVLKKLSTNYCMESIQRQSLFNHIQDLHILEGFEFEI